MREAYPGHEHIRIGNLFQRTACENIGGMAGWRDGRIQMIVSESILEEYRTVGMRLAAGFRGIDIEPFLRLISLAATLYRTPALPSQICDDPDDDKFIACALASGSKILTARDIVDRYLKSTP